MRSDANRSPMLTEDDLEMVIQNIRKHRAKRKLAELVESPWGKLYQAALAEVRAL